MSLKIGKIKNGILLSFMMIMVFSLTLSYFDNMEVLPWIKNIINAIYFLKKALFMMCLVVIISEKVINKYSIFLCTFALLSWVITITVFPNNYPYIERIGIDLICAITSFVAISSGIVDIRLFAKHAIVVSRALIIICLLSLLSVDNFTNYISRSYMVFSNAIMVPIGMVIYSAVINNKIVDYCFGLGGLLFLLFLGSRGSFLSLAILTVLLFFIKSRNNKVLYGLILIPILLIILYIINKTGVLGLETSRILQKLSQGAFFSSNDRIGIWKYLLGCCVNDVFMGHGLCADRYYLPLNFIGADSTYAHNLFVELLVDFGLIGVIISVILVALLIQYFRKEKDESYKLIVLTLFFVSFFQLLFSRSFLTEANFFIMYGIILLRKKQMRINLNRNSAVLEV